MGPSARSATGSGGRQRPSMTSPTRIEAWLQHAAWEADASCLLKLVLKSVRTLTAALNAREAILCHVHTACNVSVDDRQLLWSFLQYIGSGVAKRVPPTGCVLS